MNLLNSFSFWISAYLFMHLRCEKHRGEECDEQTTELHCLPPSSERGLNHVKFFRTTTFVWTASQLFLVQHIHYSCEQQEEHLDKLSLAPDLWGLINGLCGCPAPVWRGEVIGEETPAQTHTSSTQLFISDQKGWTLSRATGLIWRIAPAFRIHQTPNKNLVYFYTPVSACNLGQFAQSYSMSPCILLFKKAAALNFCHLILMDLFTQSLSDSIII